MTNDRDLGERDDILFSQLLADEDLLKGSPSAASGMIGTGPSVPFTSSLLQGPSPILSNASVPEGQAVAAQDDAFTVVESDVFDGSLLTDNGNGTDTAPAGVNVTVTAVNGITFEDTALIETSLGGLISIDSEGNITIEGGEGYEQLREGESVVETFTYTLSGDNVGVVAGEFDAAVDVSSLTAETGFVINGASSGDFFGISVAAAGDVNQDGFDDVIIGGYLGGADNQGRAYIVFGGSDLGGSVTVADGSFGPNGLGGFAFAGIQTNQLMGQAVGGGGDFNGDGISDLLVASPRFDTSGTNNAGSVDVIFGGQGAANVATSGFTIFGTGPNTYAGITTAIAGDVNNDGIDDILVGAWPADPGGRLEAGEIYIVFGREGEQSNVAVSDLNGQNGFAVQGVAAGDRAGTSLASAGDFNGDGIDDFIVGATHADPGGQDKAGSAYVIFGGEFAGTLNLSNAGFRLDGAAEGDYLGRSVSSAGDINGDGIDDIAVGAFNADNGTAESAGAIYVVFGGQGISGSLNASALNGTNGFTIRGGDLEGQAGVSVSSAGDVNADGIEDLLIGAHVEGANDAGAAYVVFGREGGFGSAINLDGLNGTNGFEITGAPGAGYLGWAVAGVGDVNGDRVDDIAVTAFGANGNTGQTFIVYGRGTPIDGESTATVTVTFTGENDDFITAQDDFAVSANENLTSGANVLDNDFDVDGDLLDVQQFEGVDVNGSLTISNQNGSSVTILTDGTFTFNTNGAFDSLGAGETATETYNYTATDGQFTNSETITVTITGVNDGPTANADSFEISEGNASLGLSGGVNVLDNDFDPEDDALTVTAVGGAPGDVGAQVTLSSGATIQLAADGTFSYSGNGLFEFLAAGETFVETIEYTVSDGEFESIELITVTITGENDAFTSAQDDFTVDANEDLVSGANVLDNDIDIDGDILTILEFDGLAVNGELTVTGDNGSSATLFADGTFTFDPNGGYDALLAGETATETFTYLATDGEFTNGQNIIVTITGVNDAPVAQTDTFDLFEDDGSLFSVNSGGAFVLDNDFDPEGDLFDITEVNGSAANVGQTITLASGAQVFLASDGAFDYVIGGDAQFLSEGETFVDTITYTVSDGSAQSTGIIEVTITGENDLVSGIDDSFAVNENDISGGGFNVLDNDIDPDANDVLTVAQFEGAPLTGNAITSGLGATVTIFEDGTFDYVPGAAFDFLNAGETAEDTFTYTVTDGFAETTPVTIFVTINGENDAPVASDFTLGGGPEVTTPIALTNEIEFNEAGGDPSAPVAISALIDGGFVAVSRINQQAFYRIYDEDGTPRTDLTLIDTPVTAADGSFPDELKVTGLSTGGFAVGWTGKNQSQSFQTTGIYTLTFEADGTPGTEAKTPTALSFGSINSIDSFSDGSFIVTYRDLGAVPNNADFEVYAQRYNADGTLNGASFVMNDPSPGREDASKVVAFDGGGFFVIYIDAANNTLELRGFDDSNTLIGESTLASPGVGISGTDAVRLADGSMAVAYSYSGDVFFQVLGAAGGVVVAETVFPITTGPNGGTQGEPDLTALPNGDFILSVFDNSGTLDPIGFGRVGQRYSAEGVAIGDPFLINDGNGSNESNNTGNGSTTLSNGDVIFAWTTDSGNGDGFVRVFETGEPLIFEDGDPFVASYGAFDVDDDPATLGYVILTQPTEGSVADNGDGTFIFDPGQDFQDLNDGETRDVTFTYQVMDPNGGVSNAATVTVTVQGQDEPPTAVDDSFAGASGSLTVSGDVTTNDLPDGSAPVFAINGVDGTVGMSFNLESGGTVTVNADGTFNYLAPDSFTALAPNDVIYDSFSYKLDDGTGDLGTLANEPLQPQLAGSDEDFPFLFNDDLEINGNVGYAVSGIGDINGDGIEDFAVTAPSADYAPDSYDHGKVYVLFGSTDGANATDINALDGSNGFVLTGVNQYDALGTDVAAAGDVNGDGIDDFVIASSSESGFAGAKTVYVVYGRDAITSPATFQAEESVSSLDGTNGFAITTDETTSGFGIDVDGAGDVNGDGFDDIIIGATYSGIVPPGPGGPGGTFDSGRAFIVFGGTITDASSSIESLVEAANPGDPIVEALAIEGASGPNSGGGFGVSVAGAGDVNGDGFDDVVIGAALYANVGPTTYVVFGSDNFTLGSLFDASGVDGTDGFLFGSSTNGDRLGSSVSGAGDVNGDGIDDIIIGSYNELDRFGDQVGAAFVVFGRNQAQGDSFEQRVDPSSLDGTNGFKFTGTNNNFYYDLGRQVGSGGDINGDGFDDIIVGTGTSSSGGRAYVIFGKASGFNNELQEFAINGENGVAVSLQTDTPVFAGIGDINGDGFDDAAFVDLFGSVSGYNDTGGGVIYLGLGEATLGTDPATATVEIAITGFDPGGVATASSVGDDFTGSVNGDTFDGLSGNDTIYGMEGDDVLIGNDGNDYIEGGDGNDLLIGDGAQPNPSSITAVYANDITSNAVSGKGPFVDPGPAVGSKEPWVSYSAEKGAVTDRGPVSGLDPVDEPFYVTDGRDAGAATQGTGAPAVDGVYGGGPVAGVDYVARSVFVEHIENFSLFGPDPVVSIDDRPEMPYWFSNSMYLQPEAETDFVLVFIGEEPGVEATKLPPSEGVEGDQPVTANPTAGALPELVPDYDPLEDLLF